MAQPESHGHPVTGTLSLRSEVQTYFDHFARALTAGDGATIARMWDVPALVASDDMLRAVSTMREVEQFFSGAKEQYNQMHVVDTRAQIERLQGLTERMILVDVRWPYIAADGSEHGAERSTYMLRRDTDGTLKMCFVAMRGADVAEEDREPDDQDTH